MENSRVWQCFFLPYYGLPKKLDALSRCLEAILRRLISHQTGGWCNPHHFMVILYHEIYTITNMELWVCPKTAISTITKCWTMKLGRFDLNPEVDNIPSPPPLPQSVSEVKREKSWHWNRFLRTLGTISMVFFIILFSLPLSQLPATHSCVKHDQSPRRKRRCIAGTII